MRIPTRGQKCFPVQLVIPFKKQTLHMSLCQSKKFLLCLTVIHRQHTFVCIHDRICAVCPDNAYTMNHIIIKLMKC